MPAGVRDDEPAGGSQVGDQVGVRLRERLAGTIELLDRDAVRDVDVARALQPARDEVVVGRRRDRDDRVGMPAGVALGAAHRGDERVARRDASQLDRRERPEVVHLEHQPRVRARRDRPRAVDVERMRRRRDDDVGPEAAREPPAVRAQQRRECRDVEGAAGAVARVRREPEPLEVDALDALARERPAQPGVARAHVRRRAGHDQRLVARRHPFAREQCMAGTPCRERGEPAYWLITRIRCGPEVTIRRERPHGAAEPRRRRTPCMRARSPRGGRCRATARRRSRHPPARRRPSP